MKILADPNIAFVQEAFAELGEVRLVPGRAWTAAQVRDADILLMRSVTRVDEGLLEGSRVRFVGTATSGIDHVNRDYLKRRGIAFAYAPGSNANSVAEYVVSAILALARERGWGLSHMTAGIIGYGHVGSRVARLLETVGIDCVLNDPPLKDLTAEARFLELDKVIGADIVSLHVPLTQDGSYPTLRLLDERWLARMKPNALLINTARGGVVDEGALIEQLDKRPSMTAVVDCWAHEPAIDTGLVARVSLGTPHIAGYSFDGKVTATERLYRAVCRYFGLHPKQPRQIASPPIKIIELGFADDDNAADSLRRAVLACYDVRRDAKALKQLLSLPEEKRPGYFDELRRHYPLRREFNRTRVIIPAHRPELATTLRALGFQVQDPPPFPPPESRGRG
jgi:erythronate-4-phosphate dehydrogenase